MGKSIFPRENLLKNIEFMRFIKKRNENLLIEEFIKILKGEIIKKKREKKRLSFVLTGGSSPKKLYKKLSRSNINWSNVDLFWGDERFVSASSKNSNYKLAKDLLLKKINISKRNCYSYNTKKIDILQSAYDYEIKLKEYFKKRKIKFDIFLLGMGRDGHIASIFPSSKELKEKFIVKPIIRKDFKRISLSLNIINNSRKIFLWLNNKSTSSIFTKLKDQGKNIPVNNLTKDKLYCFCIK